MKRILLLLGILNVFFCRAQQRMLPLNKTNSDSIQADDYLKDLDNDFKPFISNWKANYDDKLIMLRIIKVPKKVFKEGFGKNERKYFKDALIIQHVIMDKKGNIIEDYFSKNLDVYKIISNTYNKGLKSASFYYSGANCGVGSGSINLKMIDSNHFIWSYNGICGIWGGCPKDTDLTVNIPTEKDVIFTKQ
ncbi:hypothetical protein GCM10023210_22040 [Chryseobacterium ginsengisoli]|uniref:DUF6705 domain-containing protein n=1 Tax=Chryseobacterium ginsengisoli TaxID=363853 RepID=A0ABP9M819_9FLAO